MCSSFKINTRRFLFYPVDPRDWSSPVVLLALLARITMLEAILPSTSHSFHLPLPEAVRALAQCGLEEHHLLPVWSNKTDFPPNPMVEQNVKHRDELLVEAVNHPLIMWVMLKMLRQGFSNHRYKNHIFVCSALLLHSCQTFFIPVKQHECLTVSEGMQPYEKQTALSTSSTVCVCVCVLSFRVMSCAEQYQDLYIPSIISASTDPRTTWPQRRFLLLLLLLVLFPPVSSLSLSLL